jgi:hypothetical protein
MTTKRPRKPRASKAPKKVSPCGEAAIKAALRTELLRADDVASGSCRALNEMGIAHGSCRADFTVVYPELGKLIGVEVKSSSDTLARLPAQIEYYSSVYTQCHLVVATKHFEKAKAILPHWWGLAEVIDEPEGVKLHWHRTASNNVHVSVSALLELVWKDELVAMAAELGEYNGMAGATAFVLRLRLARTVDKGVLIKKVLKILATREHWRGAFRAS